MKNSKTAFLTTVFPSSIVFIDDFFNSLLNQTVLDFDVVVVNDGVTNFEAIVEQYQELNIIQVESSKSPVENRIEGLKFVKNEKYENLIFGDSDDFFEKNRVEVSLTGLQKNEIVVNDLSLYKDGKIEENFFQEHLKFPYNFNREILSSNIFGLSNTAIKVSVLEIEVFNIPKKIIAFDWFLFTVLLSNKNNKILFLFETSSYYRQHDSNTVGMILELNETLLHKEIKVKSEHYFELKNYFSKHNKEEYSFIFDNELKSLIELSKILDDKVELDNYISLVNDNIGCLFKGWWSRVLTFEKYKKLNENKTKK